MPRYAWIAVAAALSSTGVAAAGWTLDPAAAEHGAILGIDLGDGVTYRFECAADAMVVTQTGVTRLMDLRTGQSIDDAAAAPLPPKVAMMGLSTGDGTPNFVPASATKSAGPGWDLTIRIAKTDPQLKALGRTDMMSLFTTGNTIAVTMDSADRATWKTFLRDCGVKA